MKYTYDNERATLNEKRKMSETTETIKFAQLRYTVIFKYNKIQLVQDHFKVSASWINLLLRSS